MGRPKKLNMMTQIDGKVETFKPTTLDQIWGDTGTNKYGTMDKVIYAERLKNMNKSDLQTHATQVGLVPVDDRERLTKRLLHEFELFVSSYRHPVAQATAKTPISPEVAKILTEGR